MFIFRKKFSRFKRIFSISAKNRSSVSLWQEMIPGKNGEIINELLKNQYEVVTGRWPEAYDEIVLIVDENNMTTKQGVYAGGDAVLGARTVVEAVAIAKRVASAMDAYMQALPKDEAPDPYASVPVFNTECTDTLAH